MYLIKYFRIKNNTTTVSENGLKPPIKYWT